MKLNINQYWSFLLCLMLMLVVPIWRDHKIIGIEIGSREDETPATVVEKGDGSVVINTTDIGKDITGYGGQTPVEITVRDGRIEKVEAMPNQETPDFFGAVRNSDLLESLDGKTLEEASAMKLDGVSGATYTSGAIIANIKRGVDYAIDSDVKGTPAVSDREPLGLKFYITIIIIAAGCVVPLLTRNSRYRTLQLVLNVLILGFWGGTFISYSQMTSFLSNGITQVALIPVALMLVAAFIYPMFGKVNHYCNWLCPYGSLQELLGHCVKYKIRIGRKWGGRLTVAREILWFVLMWLLWTGLWFDWMAYEPFAAFFFLDASAVVLGIAGGFLLLSLIVQRPYCRFVCPTGSLFKFAEGKPLPGPGT